MSCRGVNVRRGVLFFRLKEPENRIKDVITANLQVWGTEGKEKLVPLILNCASAVEDR